MSGTHLDVYPEARLSEEGVRVGPDDVVDLAEAADYHALEEEFGAGLPPDLAAWIQTARSAPDYAAFGERMARAERACWKALEDGRLRALLGGAALALARHRAECEACGGGVCTTWMLSAAAAAGRAARALREAAGVFDGGLRLRPDVRALLPEPDEAAEAERAARYVLWVQVYNVWSRLAAWSAEAVCRAAPEGRLRVEARHLPWESMGLGEEGSA